MRSLLNRRVVFVTGKGGTGKTTVAAALGFAAARRGRRTIVCELGGGPARLPGVIRTPEAADGGRSGRGGLCTARIEPDEALHEWLTAHIGRAGAGLLSRSHGFRAFVAAAPGARELITMGKAWDLAQGRSESDRFDLVIIDGPSTGHAVALLAAPATYARIGGPNALGRDARELSASIGSQRELAVLGVALPSELAVAETLELEARVREVTGNPIAAVAVNGVTPRRFSTVDIEAVEGVCRAHPSPTLQAAWRAARFAYRSRRAQTVQLTHLRRDFAAPVVELPYVYATQLREAHVRELGERLAQALC